MANSSNSSYSVVNSLSPMMFRKKVRDGGTRNERMRSRSMECIVDDKESKHLNQVAGKGKKSRAETVAAQLRTEQPQWKELPLVKSLSPVVVCILPALSMDFVCSALLAVGAMPLITEDPQDMEKDLKNAKAVVVDVSAPVSLLEEFMALWDVDSCPLILVTSQAGSNDRKKELAQRIIDDSGPSVITGRLGDIYAVSQDVLEKANGSSLSVSSDSDRETDPVPQRYRRKLPAKSVDLDEDEGDDKQEEHKERQHSLPATMAPRVVLDGGGLHLPRGIRRALGRKSPSASPHGSPPQRSPRASPSSSPRASPRAIRRKKQGPLHRVATALPMVHMKGQFRDCTIGECPMSQALENGQLLAAHTEALVHLYETNVVTNGEMVVEVTNNQLGMGNLHSVHPCAGAIMAAVLACVNDQGEDVTVKECSHALGLYYVAAEEAACNATGERGVVSPGSLRQHFLDALHYLDEREVREKAQLYAHTAGTSKS